MKFIIDDANIAKVKEIWDLYPCDGVTTNPSILAKSGRNPYEVLSELRERWRASRTGSIKRC